MAWRYYNVMVVGDGYYYKPTRATYRDKNALIKFFTKGGHLLTKHPQMIELDGMERYVCISEEFGTNILFGVKEEHEEEENVPTEFYILAGRISTSIDDMAELIVNVLHTIAAKL